MTNRVGMTRVLSSIALVAGLTGQQGVLAAPTPAASPASPWLRTPSGRIVPAARVKPVAENTPPQMAPATMPAAVSWQAAEFPSLPPFSPAQMTPAAPMQAVPGLLDRH